MYNIEIALISLYVFIQTYIEKNDYRTISTINSVLISVTANYLLFTDKNFTTIYNFEESQVSPTYLYITRFMTAYIPFDIYYSLFPLKKDLLLHACLMLGGIITVRQYQLQHLMNLAMIMQTSSTFLTFINESVICKYLFALTFFIYRICIFPYLTTRYGISRQDIIFTYPPTANTIIFILISTVNVLNFYWFRKIIRKVYRKS